MILSSQAEPISAMTSVEYVALENGHLRVACAKVGFVFRLLRWGSVPYRREQLNSLPNSYPESQRQGQKATVTVFNQHRTLRWVGSDC